MSLFNSASFAPFLFPASDCNSFFPLKAFSLLFLIDFTASENLLVVKVFTCFERLQDLAATESIFYKI